MNNYKKFAAKFWGVELMIIALVNVFYYVTANDQEPDIARLQDKTGAVYKIIYTQTDDRTWILMNIALGILFLLSVFLICYIGKKIIKPFEQMQSLTEELAKGNLSVPVKAEKSKFLGRFLWGMDMLRETLENNKEKELALQKEKKTLILSLTHDIRTPLSAIRLYAKALAEELYTTGERRAEAYSGIEKNVKEIEEYVNEITLASREDFLQLSVKQGEVYLSDVIEAIQGLYDEKLRNLHTGFQIASYNDLLLKGDADRLIEVLQNLLENVIKYGDGKCISIDFSEEEDCRLITVRNSGCSLKQEELINLFDSFYRGSNVGSTDGSGLGLYISRQLLHKIDGDVFAEIKEVEFCETFV
uniref:ATP-binding protein n=1 Tax=Agathobacter sp. TaxID=2021311 RepID=UPI004029FFB1